LPRAAFTIAAALSLVCLAPARADIVVTVDKTAQRLTVEVDGSNRYQWPVSTARRGYRTPNGTYQPQWLARKWYSRQYDWSPMPYSIFFNEGYAIHGSYQISHLGRPASHGCIRLHPQNASILFALVKDHMKDTRIVVTGDTPASRVRAHNEDSQRAPRRSDANFESVFGSTPDSNLPATSWRDLR
jgi:lipoprotein-anchoring transpeptidase ErfK/SrfK